MLNSNLVKLVEILNKLCVEGYNTIDKSDIFSSLENDFDLKWDNEILMQVIDELVANKFIILKYQDEEVLCLTLTDAGKELINRIKIARQNEQKIKKSSRKEQTASNNMPIASSFDLSVPASQNEIMASLTPANTNFRDKSKIKNFLIGLLGGVLGGGISGAIITLLVLLL